MVLQLANFHPGVEKKDKKVWLGLLWKIERNQLPIITHQQDSQNYKSAECYWD